MSTQELKFKFGVLQQQEIKFSKMSNGNIEVEVWGYDEYNSFELDRNQSHLLMLYLQDHLK